MSDNTLNSLREITGEADLNCILKSTLGGYTKKSVKEYLRVVKQQQLSLKKAYDKELARILEEKRELIGIANENKEQLTKIIETQAAEIAMLREMLQKTLEVSFVPENKKKEY